MERSGMLLAVAVALATASAARGQSTIYTFPGQAAGDQFGKAVRAAGDVDGDGVADLVLGSDQGAGGHGYVRVVSGAKGTLLHAFVGNFAGERFGAAVCASDVNGDGRPDLVVGAPLSGAAGAGWVQVFDGVDGSVLHDLPGGSAGDHFGSAVAGLGDVDGDGFGDLAVGAPDDDAMGASSGSVTVVSGLLGQPLYTLDGHLAGARFGSALAAIPDLDGDGRSELLVGSPGYTAVGSTQPGWARLVSGASGATLATFTGAAARDGFGSAVAAAGDVDGDGVGDLIVGAPQPNGLAGYARVISGASFAQLLQLQGAAAGERFGSAVACAGLVDGDLLGDLAVGAPGAGSGAGAVRLFAGAGGAPLGQVSGGAPGQALGAALDGGFDLNLDGTADLLTGAAGAGQGSALALSPKSLPLCSDLHLLSAAATAPQSLHLAAGAAYAGRSYLVLGSASGTQPGLPLQGATLALNPDRYFHTTRDLGAGAMLTGASGQLDAQGEAQVAFGPLGPQVHGLLLGTTLHHAFLVFDGSGKAVLASNSVPVTLVP